MIVEGNMHFQWKLLSPGNQSILSTGTDGGSDFQGYRGSFHQKRDSRKGQKWLDACEEECWLEVQQGRETL